MSNRFSLALAIAAAVAPSILVLAPAFSQDAARLELPSQPLSQALRTLGNQTKTNILFDPASVKNLEAPAVSNAANVEDALAKMLVGSGLTYRFIDGRTVTLIPADRKTSSVAPDKSPSDRIHLAEAENPSVPAQERGQLAATAAETSLTLDEVVVTASKRQERLIDTAQSVSVLSAADLDRLGAVQFRDFANTVPGLAFTTTGAGYTQISLRGVTTGSFDISPTVGIYVDEVPYGSSTGYAGGAQLALDVGLFDMDRIEVLRGPQGTLYGASTMGGLIKYVAKKPDTESFGGDVQAGVSSTRDGGVNYNSAAAVNMPITDTAALRVSGFQSRDGGYIDNVSLGRDDVNRSDVYGGRFELLLTPTDALSVRINGFMQNISRDGQGSADYSLGGDPLARDLDQLRVFDEPLDQQFRLASGTVTYEWAPVTLTSVSSYQTVRTHTNYDLTVLYAPFLEDPYSAIGFSNIQTTDKFTQELRLASNGSDTIEWLIGGFYTDEKSADGQSFVLRDLAGQPAPNILGETKLPSRYEELAAFANLTYHFTPKFNVSGGVRYAENRQAQAADVGAPTVRSTEDVFTYLANARYHFSDRATGYIRYATGYRPGGADFIQRASDPGAPPVRYIFEADKLKSYEIGYRAETEGRRFGFDIAGYYIDWSNFQTSGVVEASGTVINVPGGADVRGAELTLTARPIDRFTVMGAFAYQDAQLSETDTTVGGVEGERLPNVPRFTATLNADYTFAFANLAPTIGATLRHVSNRNASFDGSASFPQYHMPSYTLGDLRTAITLGSVDLQLYVHNLFDERGELSALTYFGPFAEVAILQPRTFGVTAKARF